MDVLIIKLRKHSDTLDAEVVIGRRNGETQSLGWLYGLSLKDVEWLITANSSECTTPFVVEVQD